MFTIFLTSSSLEVLFGIPVELFLATLRAEEILPALVLARPRGFLLVYIHTTDRIFRHVVLPLFNFRYALDGQSMQPRQPREPRKRPDYK